ncbi:MAG: hypothetical protein AAF629_21920 [Chloroflexota bacterium]
MSLAHTLRAEQEGWFPTRASQPTDLSILSDTSVYLCQRLVDRWAVQLFLPGAEHYSIWLPDQDIHRGVTAGWYGQPLYWVDEVFIHRNQPELFPPYLSCTAIPNADSVCVQREVYRQQDEGLFTLTNHCQFIVVDILEDCNGAVPVVVPKVRSWQL